MSKFEKETIDYLLFNNNNYYNLSNINVYKQDIKGTDKKSLMLLINDGERSFITNIIEWMVI